MKPGIYTSTSRAEYDAIDAVNWSSLKLLDKSPKHYRHHLDTEGGPPSDPMTMGTAAHMAILEPHDFEGHFAVWPRERVRNGKEWEAFKAQAEADGLEIIRSTELEEAMRMRDAVHANREASALLSGGSAEATLVWEDEETDILCKARVDYLRADHLGVEVKTSADVAHHAFARTSANMLYHGQLSHYEAGIRATTHTPSPDVPMLSLAIESKRPNDVVIYDIDEEVLWPGRELTSRLLRTLKECRETNVWPGHGGGGHVRLRLPAWAVPSDDDNLADLGLE